jgi:hypothetical protein
MGDLIQMKLPEHQAVDERRKNHADPHFSLDIFTPEELQHTRLIITGRAHDIADAKDLLQMLGLINP